MSKRPSSPTAPATRAAPSDEAGPSSPRKRPNAPTTAAPDADADEGMGEFEDTFEDEFEDEDDESEEEAGSGDEAMEIDGVKLSGKIKTVEDQEAEADDDDDDATAAPSDEPQVFIPGKHQLEEGQTLEPDQSAYEMLHRLNVTWPCLSFDILRDGLGSAADRQRFPHTAYWVAGTQADTAKNNEVIVMKASAMHRTQKDGSLSDDEDDDDDDANNLDDDAILEYRSIPHLGGINRVRAAPVSPPISSLEACLDPYPVAVWSELGVVSIYDVRPLFNALDRPSAASYDKKKASTPLHVVESHGGVEGYAMDWAGSPAGSGKASSLRLLTGDVSSKIYLTTASNSGYTTHANPFLSHTSSVEDLQWSPKEPTVFASCSADRSLRIWDVRVKSKKSVIAVEEAHPEDVNVISWNRNTDYLLVSGGDEGGLKVWDLRNFKPSAASKPSAVASFNWHTAPVSSVEWHPTEDSVFAASGRDDQVTLWDLSVEEDDEEGGATREKGPNGEDVPSQLLFSHQGATEIKEVHWHSQIDGMLMSTSADGFHLFKTISV